MDGWQDGGGLYIYGTATLTNSKVYANQASNVCSAFELSSSAPLEQTRLRFSWQGGGIFVFTGGEATLIDSNVYDNRAATVCSPFELCP